MRGDDGPLVSRVKCEFGQYKGRSSGWSKVKLGMNGLQSHVLFWFRYIRRQ